MNRFQIISLTGYINVALLILILSVFILRRINKRLENESDLLKNG